MPLNFLGEDENSSLGKQNAVIAHTCRQPTPFFCHDCVTPPMPSNFKLDVIIIMQIQKRNLLSQHIIAGPFSNASR